MTPHKEEMSGITAYTGFDDHYSTFPQLMLEVLSHISPSCL